LWDKFCGLVQDEIKILKAFDNDWMCNQVYNDMVLHATISINNVMRGGKREKNAINKIREIVSNPWLQKGLCGVRSELCPASERIIVSLMKMRAALLIYSAKKMQCVLRK